MRPAAEFQPKNADRARFSRAQAVTELCISSVLFGLMAYVTKKATLGIDGAQVGFVRFGVGILAVGLIAWLRRAPLKPVRHDLLFLRGLFGGMAVLLYFLSIAALPVGTATLLNYTAPVFTAMWAALFLRERLPATTAAALAVTGVGIFLVIYGQGKALGGAYGWQAVALCSAVISGAAVTSIRAARRTDGSWEIFAAFCIFGMLCTGPHAFLRWKSPSVQEWALLGVVGVLSVVAQVLMTHALAVVEAALSGIVSQLTVVTAIALGSLLGGEPFALLSIAGASLTVLGACLAAGARMPEP
ncbi:MAG: DMT family transporter [Deltaproteobacteria bacterium]|nr:DMT family transporter [Deltaproteobacteria bacterium]